MKQRILPMLLLALAGFAGVTASAQAPEPAGQWNFSDAGNLMAATKGSMTLTPAVIGDKSISVSTVSEANITTAEGPKGSSAIFVPASSALKVDRAEGAVSSSCFSFMIDLKVPDA